MVCEQSELFPSTLDKFLTNNPMFLLFSFPCLSERNALRNLTMCAVLYDTIIENFSKKVDRVTALNTTIEGNIVHRKKRACSSDPLNGIGRSDDVVGKCSIIDPPRWAGFAEATLLPFRIRAYRLVRKWDTPSDAGKTKEKKRPILNISAESLDASRFAMGELPPPGRKTAKSTSPWPVPSRTFREMIRVGILRARKGRSLSRPVAPQQTALEMDLKRPTGESKFIVNERPLRYLSGPWYTFRYMSMAHIRSYRTVILQNGIHLSTFALLTEKLNLISIIERCLNFNIFFILFSLNF